MALILSIVGYKSKPAAEPRAQRFNDAEITVGRVPQNSFVLPDPENVVSKTHCIIRRRGAAYELADGSSNGTFLNASHEPLGRERTAALKDGDRLLIGDYDILVQISAESDAAMPAAPAPPAASSSAFLADPFGAPNPFGPAPAAAPPLPPASDPFGLQNLVGAPNPAAFGDGMAAPSSGGFESLFPPTPFDDPAPLARTPPESEPRWPPPGGQAAEPWVTPPDHTPPEQASFRPPSVAPPAIPEDWDVLAPPGPAARAPMPASAPGPMPAPASAPAMLPPDFGLAVAAPPPPRPPPQPQPSLQPPPPLADAFGIGRLQAEPAPDAVPEARAVPPAAVPAAAAADGNGLLQAFLAAAGLPPTVADGANHLDMMRQVGELLREMVAGVAEVLAARSMIKGEYRLDRTQIGAANNNPLKLSPTVDAALELLVGPARPGYMSGLRAVKEGFRDIKAHELALIAGMQASVTALLRQFDPEQLKNRLDKHSLLQSLMPGSRKAKYWEIYEQQYRQIAGDVSEDVSGVFGRAFARAYEEQIEKLSS